MTTALELREARVQAHNAGMAELVAQENWIENIDTTKDALLEARVRETMELAAHSWQRFTEVADSYKDTERARLKAERESLVETSPGVWEVREEDGAK